MLLLVAIGAAPLLGQPRTRGSGTRTTQTRPTPGQFAASFWNYLAKSPSQYKKWKPFPGHEAEIYEGESPHGAHLRLYANSVAVKDPKNVPHGSIIVKENYGEDKTTLLAITVMYRARGFDRENGDWYYVKYNPNGTVAKTPADKGGKPIFGRFGSCIKCHDGAGAGDHVFAND